jgi:hypothetical protein
MLDHLYKPASEILFEDLKRHMSPVALAALAESMRAEEPSGRLSTLSLYLLDCLEEGFAEPPNHDQACAEFGYAIVA